MTNQHTNTAPNQAVYEPHTPYDGPVGLQHGPGLVQGQPIVAIHENSDGSFAGVADDGTIVHMPVQ